MFWFLLLAAASISLYAAFSVTRPPSLAQVSEDFERSLTPIFNTAAPADPAFQSGRLLVGEYRIVARQELDENGVPSRAEYAPGLHQTVIMQAERLLQLNEAQQIAVGNRLLAGPFTLGPVNLVISRPLTQEESLALDSQEQQDWLPRLLVLASVITGIGALVLGIWFVRPLIILRNATREIAAGQAYPNLRKLPKRRDELGELARAMKRTAEELAVSRDAQRRLLSDVSHELRSPLTRSQIALDLLQEELTGDNVHVNQLNKDVQRLGHIIESILWLSRLENGLDEPITEPFSLNTLLGDIQADLSYGKDDWRERLHVKMAQEEITLETDALLVRLVVENLIRNAFQYGGEQSPVEVYVQLIGSECAITVRDHGAGVAEEKLEELFQPFFRADPSRHHGAGVGLGLALCQRASRVLQGELHAENHPEGGFAVTLSIPCSV
ncbi:HAMP domain-containing sensor histidine kinase [Lysobacter sp. N42]|uniref:sensor histidine kinase n=1 Tax=Lysobacter sp. N42 TaxID=2545719 RepID=UPI0014044B72|nr:HAMP domain-containing sensor histidine kinase [Lysobacter sp. N42]